MKKANRLSRARALLLYLLLALPILVFLQACDPASSISGPASRCVGENSWRVGNIVYVCQGTQIWQAPELGSCYHTVVPVNNWEVRVTGGPRSANGRTWYDTSRRDAGDPSGGTGWINVEQANRNDPPFDDGAICPGFEEQVRSHRQQIADSKRAPPTGEGFKLEVPRFLLDLQAWWYSQILPVKIGVLVAAFALLFFSGRFLAFGGPLLSGLVKAVLWGVILAGVADLSRPVWQSVWNGLVGTKGIGVDAALLLLVVPLAWWAFTLIAGVASKIVGIAMLVILGAVAVAYVAPDRFSELVNTVRGWFNIR